MKEKLIWINSFLFVAAAIGGYFSPEVFWQPLLINLSTTFFAIALGVVVVNIYLDKASRQGAVISLLQLSDRAIAEFHDSFLDMVWTRFSKDEWAEIVRGYTRGGGDVMTIKPDYRTWIYELAKEKQNKLNPLIQDLDDSLQEIISLVGWSLDDELLACALRARNAIRLYRGIPYDDTEAAHSKICEHLIDMMLQASSARGRLMDLSGIQDD
jgi:hypothetical protein